VTPSNSRRDSLPRNKRSDIFCLRVFYCFSIMPFLFSFPPFLCIPLPLLFPGHVSWWKIESDDGDPPPQEMACVLSHTRSSTATFHLPLCANAALTGPEKKLIVQESCITIFLEQYLISYRLVNRIAMLSRYNTNE
jgi:hypothetical protein